MNAGDMFDADGNVTPAGMQALMRDYENAEGTPLIGQDPAAEL